MAKMNWMVLFLLGCTDAEVEDGDPVPQISGTIATDYTSDSAEVEIYSGFGFDQGGTFISYFSSNPESSCESITAFLQEHDGPHDPSDVLVGGTCDIYYKITAVYESDMESSDDPMVAAGMAINCYMGEGGWELETRDSDDTDYYWQGDHWQGHPTAFSMGLSGGAGSDYRFDLEMTVYDGNFIYEDFDNDPASGDVGGSISVEWCPGLGTTPLF